VSEEMGDHIEYEFELRNNAVFRKQGLRLVREGMLTLDENVFPYSTEGDLLDELREWISKFDKALEINLIQETREQLKDNDDRQDS
jgi:hypothetical protein